MRRDVGGGYLVPLEFRLTSSDVLPDHPADGVPEPWRAEGAVLIAHLQSRGAFTAEQWAAALAQEAKGAEPDFPAWVRAVQRLMGPDDRAPVDISA